MKKLVLPMLLSLIAGFVDTLGYLGLAGLFTAHVTGNFVTLGASLVQGTSGAISKILALPVFLVVAGLMQPASALLTRWRLPALRLLLALEVALLVAYLALGVTLGPFADGDAAAAMLTGMCGVAAMAVQNGVQRVHLRSFPPTTIMTSNATQLALDAATLLQGGPVTGREEVRARLTTILAAVLSFAVGAGLGAVGYAVAGFASLVLVIFAGIAAIYFGAALESSVK